MRASEEGVRLGLLRLGTLKSLTREEYRHPLSVSAAAARAPCFPLLSFGGWGGGGGVSRLQMGADPEPAGDPTPASSVLFPVV